MKKPIDIITTFIAGAGTIVLSGVDGAGGDVTQTCDPANPNSPQTITVQQSTGPQNITVSGTAPSGGSITVEVYDSGNLLTSGTYTGLFTNGSLNYIVPPPAQAAIEDKE